MQQWCAELSECIGWMNYSEMKSQRPEVCVGLPVPLWACVVCILMDAVHLLSAFTKLFWAHLNPPFSQKIYRHENEDVFYCSFRLLIHSHFIRYFVTLICGLSTALAFMSGYILKSSNRLVYLYIMPVLSYTASVL